jgi:hypothetical protein
LVLSYYDANIFVINFQFQFLGLEFREQ